ncbi:MAG: DUF5124 domain-containing protein [Bacteroides thetaiotaomicron]
MKIARRVFSCISMVLTDGSVSGKWVTDFKLDPGQGPALI